MQLRYNCTMKTKKCPACNIVLVASTENFYRDAKKPSGLSSWCKKCTGVRRKANPESRAAISKRVKKYKKTLKGRESDRRNQHIRRARVRGLPYSLTNNEWNSIKEYYGGRCAYCGSLSSALCQDHVIPLAQGGGYTKENIVPACGSCNSHKNARTPEQANMELIKPKPY